MPNFQLNWFYIEHHDTVKNISREKKNIYSHGLFFSNSSLLVLSWKTNFFDAYSCLSLVASQESWVGGDPAHKKSLVDQTFFFSTSHWDFIFQRQTYFYISRHDLNQIPHIHVSASLKPVAIVFLGGTTFNSAWP